MLQKYSPKIGCWIFLILALISASGSAAEDNMHPETKNYTLYVGTYTQGGNSKGIYAYHFDSTSGEIRPLGLAAESANPSFLAVDATHRFLYAINELEHHDGQPTGTLSAFAIESANGNLSLLNRISAQDPVPAHIVLDRTGKYVVTANYLLGSVAVFPILADGKLGDVSDFVRHKGSSIDKARQEGPHGHAVALSFDNRYVIAADLGLDEVIVYPFDATKGKLGQPQVTKVKPGSGPRHITFSHDGKFLYLISEMGSTITAFSYDAANGTLKELQTVSTLPQGYKGESTTAEIAIHPSGNFLYGSNRGDDSIVVFAVDKKKGTLTFVERMPTQGKEPRHFAIDPSGHWLLAENQKSDTIMTFGIDQKTGKLTGHKAPIKAPTPVCLVFVPER